MYYFGFELEKNIFFVIIKLIKVIDKVKVRRFSWYLWWGFGDGYVF